MTIDEFKAFLEGMDVQDCPTPEQWARIKAKIEGLEAFRFTPWDPNRPGRTYISSPAPTVGPISFTPWVAPAYTTC